MELESTKCEKNSNRFLHELKRKIHIYLRIKKNFSNEIYFVIIFMLNKKFTFSPAVWVSAGTEPN